MRPRIQWRWPSLYEGFRITLGLQMHVLQDMCGVQDTASWTTCVGVSRFPPDIVAQVETIKNMSGKLANSDFELAAAIIQFVVLALHTAHLR